MASNRASLAREGDLLAEQGQLTLRLGALELNEEQSAKELAAILAAGADDRGRLIAAEKGAAEARERLRVAEQQTRKSEVAQMEARLQLEQVREQLLVELAGIGEDGLVALRQAAGRSEPPTSAHASDESANATTETPDAYEALLADVIAVWQSVAPSTDAEETPSANRLGNLRRRFHDLGAGNPFAVEEYAELQRATRGHGDSARRPRGGDHSRRAS